jgi:phage terminase large subunit-like protein
MAGEIIACLPVKQACTRHLRDLEVGGERGLVWNAALAQWHIAFYPKFLRHSKGEWARKPLELAPWQKFIIGSVFGWERADGTRRFRYVYEEVPRKNGKSTMLAGVGLDMLVCDSEEGAEIYAAATKKDQARIIFDEAKRMVGSSPALADVVARLKLNLSVDSTSSKFEPLSSDENTLDGLNPHCVLIDELHKHRNRSLLDVMDTAVGARRQPILWIITTAGDDSPESVYAAENDYASKVLQGTIEDDNTFAFIATIDKGDVWDDPRTWAKANPNLGISVKADDLERQAMKARKSPQALSAFMRLRLNVRSSSIESAVDMIIWAQNGGRRRDPAELKGRKCWGGLDLSSKIDISAWVKLFEPDEVGGPMIVMPRFWMPADTLEARIEKDRGAQYRRWVDEGYIEVTPGNVVDHDEIERAVAADNEEFKVQSVAYDPWNATQLSSKLYGQGVPMVEFVQGLRSYSEPTKELLNMLIANKLDHGDNPVLRWMAANLKTHRDKNENLMPHKLHSTGRIDGMTALIMAIGRFIHIEEKPKHQVIIL